MKPGFVTIFLLLLSAIHAAAETLHLAPCRLPGVPDEARCGTYEVFEDRDARSGRKIALNVAVLPAQGPDRLPDPIVFFDGGPGEPSLPSYRTRAVLVYLRRHPESVRTATIFGVLPTDARVPLPAARNAQRSLDALFAACAREPSCATAFPDLPADLATVLRRREKPVPVEIIDPDTEKKVSIVLTREGVTQTLRYMLYSNFGMPRLPLALHRAAAGDFGFLGTMAYVFGTSTSEGSRGLYLSVTCAEDVAFIREEEIPAAVAGTFLGDFRIRRQIEACKEWPAAKLGPEFLDPVVSDVPVLAISGERDPTTPPANGEQVIRPLKRGRLVVVPHRAHAVVGVEGSECVVGVIDQFIEAGSAERLATGCIERMPPVPFVLGTPAAKAAVER